MGKWAPRWRCDFVGHQLTLAGKPGEVAGRLVSPARSSAACPDSGARIAPPRSRLRSLQRGSSWAPLLLVAAALAILAAIAIPSYNEQVRKSRRAEAASELARLQMAQERWRADRPNYATLAQLGATSPIPSGYYTLAVATPGGNCASGVAASAANSFSITATAAGAQASDSKCATMTITSLCGTVSKTSTGGGQCW